MECQNINTKSMLIINAFETMLDLCKDNFFICLFLKLLFSCCLMFQSIFSVFYKTMV